MNRKILFSIIIILNLGCVPRTLQLLENRVGSGNTDKLFVVDCLLPGQVIQLGKVGAYLTAGRPIKTTGSHCEIRGGEYVAYDRANYATSLKVWLPKAQVGDPEAQVYVGEIFEKGLGLQPDYQVAAEWYRKSAEQGNSRAQINLGYLYEKGLGVRKDSSIAMDLYRKSSGLSKTDIPYAATLEISSNNEFAAEFKYLSNELDNSQKQSKILADRLADTQQQLQRSQNQLILSNALLDNMKQQLKTASLGIDRREGPRLEQIIREKEQEVSRERENIAQLKRSYKEKANDLTDKLDETEKRASQIAEQLKKHKSFASDSQFKLLAAQAELARMEKRFQLQMEKRIKQSLKASDEKQLQQNQLIGQLETEKEKLEKK